MAGQELDQDIDVAVGPRVVAQDGPEQRQSGDMMPSAERRDSLAIDRKVRTHRLASGVNDGAIRVKSDRCV